MGSRSASLFLLSASCVLLSPVHTRAAERRSADSPFSLSRVAWLNANTWRGTPRGNRVPEAALRALEEKRFFHASLLLRDYLATLNDTTPADRLLAGRAEAGWGDWERVAALLAGQNWLDSVSDGLGWWLLGRSYYDSGQWDQSRSALARYLEVTPASNARQRGLAELYRGHAAREAGAESDAVAAYDRAAALLPDAADWIGLQSVAALASTGDTAQVNARLASMDGELAREWGWRHRVRAFRAAADLKGAAGVALKATTQLVASGRRAEAWVELGSLRSELGDPAGAREAFRNAISTAPGSSGAVDGARLLGDMKGLTADDRLLIGQLYLRVGNLQRGTAGIQAYLNAGKGSAGEREHLRYQIANAWFRSGRYDDSERVLLGIARRNIVPSLGADALFLAGRAQYRDGRTTQARKTFLEVASRYPKQDAAAEAMYLSADLDHDDGNLELAEERYRRTIRYPGDVDEVGLAHMRLGGIAYQQEDWTGARKAFETYRSAYPNGRRYVQASYWSALSSRKLGDDSLANARLEEVLRLDPFSYYGGHAASLLGRSFWDVPLRLSPPPDSAATASVRDAMRRVDLLRDMDWKDAADYEVDRVRRRFAGSKSAQYELAEALDQRGYTTIAIGIGWELFRREGGWSDRLLRIIYPFPWQDIVVAEADEAGVDPFIAAALIRQESMFNANAVSPKGAVGLMQVLPATGSVLARQLGMKHFRADLLTHPELNAHLGTRFLADQLQSFGGRLPVVLAAYNAGPNRIDRWQEFPEFADDEQFAERIPFAETRDYVKIVQNNARIYEALYKPAIEARKIDR